MTDTSLDFAVNEFDGTLEEFLTKAKGFNENNSQYRGFDQLNELIEQTDFSEYDLYQIKHADVLAGLAAVKFIGDIIHFDIFVVDPDFREIGIGDELFTFIVTQEKYKNANYYESKALPGDRHTKNFFETRKGKARLLIVRGEIQRT